MQERVRAVDFVLEREGRETAQIAPRANGSPRNGVGSIERNLLAAMQA
jgi:hypothetical protein